MINFEHLGPDWGFIKSPEVQLTPIVRFALPAALLQLFKALQGHTS